MYLLSGRTRPVVGALSSWWFSAENESFPKPDEVEFYGECQSLLLITEYTLTCMLPSLSDHGVGQAKNMLSAEPKFSELRQA